MKKRLEKPWPRRPRGMTLVEVVAGSALLGTLLVTILLAQARIVKQAGLAGRRIEACGIADGLLELWWSDPEEFRVDGSGDVQGREGWSWRTNVVENQDVARLGAHVVALEIFGPGAKGEKSSCRIEILRPGRKGE